MLQNKIQNERTYEEIMNEVLIQIPLYSKEWTNFNHSDPGITTLEIFSAYHTIQNSYINRISIQAQLKLLKLVGFEPMRGKCAKVLLECKKGSGEPVVFPDNQKFRVGDVCFETNRAVECLGHRLIGIYGERNGQITDYSYILDPDIPLGAMIFGEKPEAGMHIYFVTDGFDKEEDIIFYISMLGEAKRNPFEDKLKNDFAKVTWECYTEEGFVEASSKDYSGGFLVDGELRIRIPSQKPAIYEELPQKGYVLRGTLDVANYDLIPKLLGIDGFLFEVMQKETQSICYTFNRFAKVEVYSDLLEEGYFQVFCKENKGESYKRYSEMPDERSKGRYYIQEHIGYGKFTFVFDKRKFKYGPARIKNALKIVAYNEEMMRKYRLGTVYGYDNQLISLPVKNVVHETFSIIAEREDEIGEKIYDFVKPERNGEGELNYQIYEDEGKIVIRDPGDFIGAELFLCSCAVSNGTEGNVRAGNAFEGVGLNEYQFVNPGPGRGGRYKETIEELKKRFVEDVNRTTTAVLASDYENLVFDTPELCIHKVKAIMDYEKNTVNIVVAPFSDQPFPTLSPLYQKAIYRQLDSKRLLGTDINIIQPAYVPIDVSGIIYVKRHHERCREQIEEVIKNAIDYMKSNRQFGELLKFDEVFHAIEALDCVDYIYELTLHPRYSNIAALRGVDIKPADNCLCYPGTFSLEVGNFEK